MEMHTEKLPDGGLQTQYLITATQFYHEGYAEKILRGEVKVYMVEIDLLSEPAYEKPKNANEAAHNWNLERGVYFSEMGYLEPVIESDDGFIYHEKPHPSGGQGCGLCDATHQFLVISNEQWITVQTVKEIEA